MTATISSWPAHTNEPKPVPLPRLGECPDCGEEIRIRYNGRLYAHGCTGDGATVVRELAPTFARWLWTQSKRRDDYTNLATLVAGNVFRGCTRSAKHTAADVDWTTANELHELRHSNHLALTGSDAMGSGGQRCGSACRDLHKVAALYEQLIEAAGGLKKPGPVIHVRHRPAGWVLPDYSDLADCTTNHIPANADRTPCTAPAVWKVVEDHGLHLTISFWCDTDLPVEHRPQQPTPAP